MKKENVDRFFAALDAAFKPLGIKHFDEAIRFVVQGLREIADRLAKYQDREAFRNALENLPPDVPHELLQEAEQKLPNAVYMLRRVAPDAIKEIPHAPGGRPKLPVQAQQQEICQEIGALIVKGVPLSVAYKRIGQRYGASARTIQRIWNQRHKE